MPKPNYPPEFESQVRKAMDVPEPDAEKLDALREHFIALGAASLRTDRGADSGSNPYRPEKESKMKRINFRMSPRLAWGLALLVLAILFALAFSSPTVVNALRRLLGYIPGVGVIDQSQTISSTILALEEPVTIQREGVTLTVEFAIATSEKTTILYRHAEPPVDFNNYLPPETYPEDRPVLRLPDGNVLDIIAGRRQPSNGVEILYALDFPPLPEGVTQVTLELTRLSALPPGLAPENWEIPIRFTPIDLAHVIIPVVEYEPTPTFQVPTENLPQPTPAFGASITLERYVELPDGYLLMGSFQWTDTSIPPYTLALDMPVITDADGRKVEYDFGDADAYPQPNELRQYWAYKTITKDFTPPLKLEFHVQMREQANAEFQFDPGANPQTGQTWDLNLNVPVNGRILKVVSVTHYEPIPDIHNFDFVMSSDTDIVGAMIIESNHPPMGGGGGGGGSPQVNAPFTSGLSFEGQIPSGPLTIVVTSLDVLLPGDWTITWQP